jgi:uncharacterized protein YecT (DUF1311 family)
MNHSKHQIAALTAIFAALLSTANPSVAETPQSAMDSCVAQAADRKGEERKKFMTECLRNRQLTVDAPKADPCDSGGAFDSMQCAAPVWEKSEHDLNVAYRELRANLKKSGLARLERNLVEAQRAWVEFREKHCSFDAAVRVEGNSWNSYWTGNCMAAEADARTQYLRQSLQ